MRAAMQMKRLSTDASVPAAALILGFAVWPILVFGLWFVFLSFLFSPASSWLNMFSDDTAGTAVVAMLFFGIPVIAAVICFAVFRAITVRGNLSPGNAVLGWVSVAIAAFIAACFWAWVALVPH